MRCTCPHGSSFDIVVDEENKWKFGNNSQGKVRGFFFSQAGRRPVQLKTINNESTNGRILNSLAILLKTFKFWALKMYKG